MKSSLYNRLKDCKLLNYSDKNADYWSYEYFGNSAREFLANVS